MNHFRKNMLHITNFIDYIIEHLICVFVLLLVLVISGIILVNLASNPSNNMENQEILIFGVSLSNWQIWYTFIGLIITAIWSMYQYTKSVARKQQEKAASIAKEFSQGLLDKCGLVTTVYKKSKLYDLLNMHEEYTNFKNFTIYELRDVYGNDFPYKYQEQEKKCDLDSIYHNLLTKRISLPDKSSKSNNDNESSESLQTSSEQETLTTIEAQNLFILDNSDLPFRFRILVNDVLNELEFICMDISSQAAGSKYIYQSLHQIFFRTIKVLSIEICLRNKGKYCDKYYTNIIHVYNEWTKIYKKASNKEKKRKKKVDKILNPKIKTV